MSGAAPRPASGRNRPRALARALRSLAASLPLAIAAMLLAPAQQALAQSSTLVSNMGEANNFSLNAGVFGSFVFSHATQFTTGSNAQGYTLTAVDLHLTDWASGDAQVSIWSSTAGGAPDTQLHTLSEPASLNSGIGTFTASSVTLTKDTKYHVVVQATSGNAFEVRGTSANGEDSGKAAGWSIADGRHFLNQNNANWQTDTVILRMRIKGSIVGASTDATLSGLALENAADSSAISLNETFAAATTGYTASVANGVTQITVKPTKNDSDATVAILDGADMALDDADDMKTGHQVNLVVGANTIKIKVTAEDRNTSRIYTIAVNRFAAQGQMTTAFVSNTGQNSISTSLVGNDGSDHYARGQQFTTGDNPSGYRLTHVVAALGAVGSDAIPKVSIYSNRTQNTGDRPRNSLYVLTNPGSFSANANNTFTAPEDATLSANTKYWVVFENDNTGTANSDLYRVSHATSGNEDAGRSSGWSIADERANAPNSIALGWFRTHGPHRIAIQGTIPSTDAKLSALALENAADSSAITLSPAFNSSTTSYTAAVTNAVGQVTVEPTKSHSGAQVAYLDASGAEIDDADTVKAGHQADLDVGANTIRVKVTAQDGVTTETYTITVSRAPPLWTTIMTVGADTLGGRGFSRVSANNLGDLDDNTFEYPATEREVTSIAVTSTEAAFVVRRGGSALEGEGLVLEWAGETLPLDDATRSGNYFRWSQSWLAANAPSLAAANYAATLPEGGRGTVCLRQETETCPSTAIATNSAASGAPEISGFAQAGATLTASLGTLADADGLPSNLTWQWVRVDGANETDVGTNSATYTPVAADVGKTLKVEVSFTDRGGFSEGPLESAETAAVLAAPAACPARNDWCATLTVGEGSLLAAISAFGFSRGTLNIGEFSDRTIDYDGATYTVNWLAIFDRSSNDTVDIWLDAFLPRGAVFTLGGTAFTADADSEQSTTGRYEWDRPANFAWADGQRVTVSVRFPNRAATGAPTVSGTASVGETLAAGLGDIADEDGLPALFPDDYSFRWVRVDGSSETDIPGATGRTYTLKSADQGKKVKVKVRFTDKRGYSETRTSDAHPSIDKVAGSGSVPSVSLVQNLDQSAAGNHSGSATIAQQFTTGSHSRGYLLGRVKIKVNNDKVFTLKVCETNSSGSPTSTCTSLTAPGSFGSNFGTTTLTFSAPAGTRLDASTKYAAVADPTGSGSLEYPYTTSDAEDSGAAAGWSIANAHHLRSGSSWSRNGSGRSLLIAIEGSPAPNRAATGAPAISGTAAVGETLTAGIGTVADGDGLPSTFADDYDLQWFRVVGGTTTAIPGATSGTYTLKVADAGAKIRLRANFTDDGGSAETLTAPAWPANGTVVTRSTPSSGLVGNTGQDSSTRTSLVGLSEFAQGFRTGSNAGGYRLDSIGIAVLHAPSGAGASTRAELRMGASANATAPTNDAVAVLSNPSNLANRAGVKSFSAPGGTRLEPDTNYFLFISYSGSGAITADATSANGEDAGRAAGWSIADGQLLRNRGSTGSWTTSSDALKISVEGAAVTNPAIGMPTISGTPQAGQTLTASADGIVDPDGLPSSFTWQWVRVSPGGAETVVGTNAATYTLTGADAGATMVAKASFTDRAGNDEGPLASAPTDTIAAAPRQCPEDNIWCRTVTADDSGGGAIGLVTGSESLADRRFSHDGDTYTVSVLSVNQIGGNEPDELFLRLDRFLPRGTALHVGGREFVTSADSEQAGTGEYVWDWPEDAVLFDGQRVRLALRPQVNDAASGAPAISGKAQVGVTLLAGVGGLSDPNGLDGATYSYQWVRVDADGTSNPTDIGTDSPSYTLTADDQGKRIRVKVSFTDDIGFEEGPLESDAFPASGTVAAVSTPTVGALVGNIGQGNLSSLGSNTGHSQQFTTGSAAGGYPVTGVDIVSNGTVSFTLKVCETNNSGAPTSTCTTFTAPGTFAAGTLSFAAPANTVLAANTTYTVVVCAKVNCQPGTSFSLSTTSSDAEDAGNAAGWSIANSRSARNSGTLDDSGHSLRIAIKGTLSNTAATGAPAITGAPQAGGTLTADTSGIADPDGLTNASYSYRWIRVAGDGTETVVALDTATYTPRAADVGHNFKLAVGFDDDNGNYESRESPEVGPVAAAATACPANAIWCRTVTADDVGGGVIQLVKSSDSLADRRFSHDGANYTLTSLQVNRLSGEADTLTLFLNRFLPRGTALHIAGHEVVTDADSEESAAGEYAWDLPDDFTLHDGQQVTLRLDLAGSNAALSALALENAADDTPIPLSPAFRQETASYTAAAGTPVRTLTLRATAASSRATIAYLDTDNAPIADADDAKDGFQLKLPGGRTRIQLRITAEDNVTTRTYNLAVTREPWKWDAIMAVGGDAANRGFAQLSGSRYGSLSQDGFRYTGAARTLLFLAAGNNGVRLRTDAPLSELADLVLEWAGETLPVAEAALQGAYLTWNRAWLDANAPSLAAANYRVTLPENHRGRVCLRTEGASCPATRIAANRPATGKPTVRGAPQVGETLTAYPGAIRDRNGTEGAEYEYQWVRVDGGSVTVISGATAKTYTARPADEGKTLKVRVAFTDDIGYREGDIASDPYPASGTILPARAACPADAGWCSAMTVGTATRGGTRYTGYHEASAAGEIEGDAILVGNRRIGIERLALAVRTGLDAVELLTEDVELPRGTVLVLDTAELTLDASSRQGSNSDRWNRPSGLAWTDGQKVTVSLKLPAWTRDTRIAALSLENAADDTPIAFDPPFGDAADSYEGADSYTALVPRGVDRVTIEAEAAESRSRVGYYGTRRSTLDPLPDADAGKDGRQADLWDSEDNTIIYARVTAWDRSHANYRLTVRRVDQASLTGLTLTYPGRMIDGDVGMRMAGTSSRVTVNRGGKRRPPFSGTETLSRCLGGKFALRGADGVAKTNVEWSLEQFGETDSSGLFAIGADGQVRTVVGKDYPFRDGVGKLRFTVRGKDVDSGEDRTAGVTVYVLHPDGDTIHTEDCANPGLTVADASAAEGPGATLDFTVTLRPPAEETVTVAYATSDGDATAPDDYTETTGTLTFAPGETEKTVSVPVVDDTVEDSGEMLTFTLSGATGAVLADPEATGTIYNDEDEMPAEPGALTAAFEDAPGTHDGESAFSFTLAFSEDLEVLSGLTLTGGAFQVTGGTVTGATRKTEGSNLSWTVQVEPDGEDDVEILLPATTDCTDAGAICAADGRMLSGTVSETVTGPAPAASFPEPPEAHDGTDAFELRVSFTAALATGGASNRVARALSATGGTISRVRRVDQRRDLFSMQVQPDGDGAVTVTLDPPTEDCDDEDALCTPDGRAVSKPASATVPGPDDATTDLTAFFSGAPDEHDGTRTFALSLTFSEDVDGLHHRTLRDHAFQVTGGTVKRAKRVTQGANRVWTIRIAPDGPAAPVTIVLPETADCEADGAICMPDGRMLSSEARATVQGPPAIAVADAEANEADTDAALDFKVTLSRAASGTVTVDYETSDGTATAPGDYEETAGTLTFQEGETEKTISVPVVNDAENEGSETMTLTLSNATGGAYLEDATATGTIHNTGAIPQAWIARFGRTVADQLLAAIEERLGAARAPGAEIGLGGQKIGLGPIFGGETGEGAGPGGTDGKTGGNATVAAAGNATGGADGGAGGALAVAADEEEKARLEALTAWLNGENPDEDAQENSTRSMTGREVLMGSSFSLAARTGDGGAAALWGRIAQSRFAGREGTLTLDGDVTTGLLGLDRAWDRWTAGLLVSRSAGTGGYSGESAGDIDATLTAVTPWAGYTVSETLSLWGAAGYGAGELTVKPDKQAAMKTGLSMKLAAGGLRAKLVDGDGPRLDAVTGARWVQTSSARLSSSAGNLAAATADVWRLNLGLEGSWPLALGEKTAGGATATPRLALGLRHDGGDAETGYGVDIAGGIDLALPGEGLTMSVSGRGVLSHEAAGLSDRGIAGTLAWNPGSSGRGPSLSLSQTFGAGASSGKDALLARETLEGLAANDNGSEFDRRRLEARFGYGFGMFGGGFTATPELALGLSQAGRDYSLGWKMVRDGSGPGSLELSFEATRRESANDTAPPEHGVGLRLTARW